MEQRDFKGIWIPREIWLNKELTVTDRCLLAEINSLDGENHCFASNEYFAEFFGVSVPTITRSIAKLKTMGFINTEMVTTKTGRKINMMSDLMNSISKDNIRSEMNMIFTMLKFIATILDMVPDSHVARETLVSTAEGILNQVAELYRDIGIYATNVENSSDG